MMKKKFAFEFIEENEEELTKAIKRLRGLVDEEKFLKVRKDDNFLLRYLRCSQYVPEIAIEKMKAYYALKHQHPGWYITDESVASFQPDLSSHLVYMLEDRDRFGKRICINRLGSLDPSKTTIQRQAQIQDIFLECILDEEETQKSGISILVDMKNFSWAFLKWLTPSNISTAVKKIESLPLKKLEFHTVNTSVVFNAAIKIVWPFLSSRTKENIHFHYEDWPSLHKIIDPQYLPQQYGGTKSDIDPQKLLDIIPGSKERLSSNLRLGYAKNSD